MAEIVVRKAVVADDVAAVRTLLQAYGDHLAANPTGAANICIQGYVQELERLPEPYFALLLAEVDGVAAGCVALRGVAKDESACEMKRLWVDGAFRGLGLGRRLVQEAILRAKALGLKTIYLDTVPAAMPEANRLYAAVGFEPTERYNENSIADVAFFRLSLDGRENQSVGS
jgi:N-acetylglutamate synthase-like GNAT family acetyltransferase